MGHVNLTVPNQGVAVDREKREIYIPFLKLTLNCNFRNDFEKVNQVELDEQYVHASVSVPEKPVIEPKVWLDMDRDAHEGSTDTPKGATLRTTETPEPPKLKRGEYVRLWHRLVCRLNMLRIKGKL